MSETPAETGPPAGAIWPGGDSDMMAVGGRIPKRKAKVAAIRERAAERIQGDHAGILVAASLAEKFCRFTEKTFVESAEEVGVKPAGLSSDLAVLGVGGTGRGLMAPYSDLDMMILCGRASADADAVTDRFVRSLWDSGLKPGHSIRTPAEAVKLGVQDAKTGTSYVETRLIWGSDRIHESFTAAVRQQVIDRRGNAFIDACLEARASEFTDAQPAVQTLEPNVKTGLGGLRDIHLLKWVAAAAHQTFDTDVLQLSNALSPDDAGRLRAAHDFLLRTRIWMHLETGGPQEILRRDLQVSLASAAGYEDTPSQRGVEAFMQEYFRHSTAVAEVTGRFVERNRPKGLRSKVAEALGVRRAAGGLLVGLRTIDVRPSVKSMTLDRAVECYEVAGRVAGRRILPHLADLMRAAAVDATGTPSEETLRTFREILGRPESLPAVLRHMAGTGVLSRVMPAWAGIESLLQFNQYHSYTVDEHTLRAVEEACSFATDDGPFGRAYKRVKSRDLFHLAVLLHDIGKGHEEDHSVLGARIAERVGTELGYDPASVEQLRTLVLEHLNMADAAFRRDISDESLLLSLAGRLGSPETLLMLYLLTVADIRAVGPGTWTPWKAQLLTDLFERVMVIVSGRNYGGYEEEREAEILDRVLKTPPADFPAGRDWSSFVTGEFRGLPTYYLMSTHPPQIAEDLAAVAALPENGIRVTGHHDPKVGITEYRVIIHRAQGGCFQTMCGVLAARHFSIISAQIATTRNECVIDAFRVRDPEYVPLAGTGDVPPARIEEICGQMESALRGEVDVATLFAKYEKYDAYREDEELPSGLASKVQIDNDTSEDRTIIDVFTKDRRGLLYFLAKSIWACGVELVLAKISTHFDQVVDVFYVTEPDGQKLTDERAEDVRRQLAAKLNAFVAGGFLSFRRT